MASAVDRLRDPAHTGANRCLPCTAVNIGLAAVAALAVATVSVPLALLGFALAIATIALRGYLVPGTPQLTARYLPDRVLAWVHDADGSGPSAAGTPQAGASAVDSPESDRDARVDGTTFLVGAGVLTTESRDQESRPGERGAPDEEGEAGSKGTARKLTGEFRARVARELDRLPRADTLSGADGGSEGIGSRRRRPLADLFDAAPGDVAPADRPYPAVRVGHRVRGWPSPAALRSDLASHAVLDARTDRWREIPVDQRVELLETIRSHFERCPDCDGAITVDETPVESCCVDSTVATHRCSSCGARLLEFDPDRADVDTDRPSGLK
ncbi:hypothetical protein [Halovivax limisalsi]|uniref:hypothetical protein n=1 Tax=Halovivax limisalsi TaxID=1453760 RepID=UPI001FFD7BB2|nr:hypothetical protein [Halovivax limisalsi]